MYGSITSGQRSSPLQPALPRSNTIPQRYPTLISTFSFRTFGYSPKISCGLSHSSSSSCIGSRDFNSVFKRRHRVLRTRERDHQLEITNPVVATNESRIISETEEFVAQKVVPQATELSEVQDVAVAKPRVWQRRWTVMAIMFVACMLCNMDRVNMSIAILPMQTQFNWDVKTVGLIQSSFFWGYLLTQIIGGVWADKLGGKMVLGFGVIWWSISTAFTPIAAHLGLPALLISRMCMGIGEGVAMPAMNNLVSRWTPRTERSRSLAFVFSGLHVGSIVALFCSPLIITRLSWPSVFYIFGSMGLAWFVWWMVKAQDGPTKDPTISQKEKDFIISNTASQESVKNIPWKQLLSRPEVWSIIICHFCHNWGLFILLTWMPTYYSQVLGFDLRQSGIFSVLPWVCMALCSQIAGYVADKMLEKNVDVTIIRKIMQTVGFLGPAFFLTQLSQINTPLQAVLCMCASQGLDAFSHAGLYSNHQDIAPRYAGVLLGMSNTAGVLAGVMGTAATGYILHNGQWSDVWTVAVGLYLIGTLVWNFFATGEKLFD